MKRFLPPIGSVAYHILLTAVAILILGPLGGVSAAYMNFSLGFFVGGQVLAGILGSVVTYAYGAEGKHGANYMQTLAASVASMSGMAVLVQAMVWLGLPEPASWKLILFFTCIGMFGVGVGMLYTPILVDRMQLPYPSGFAVANILRSLTDKTLLKQSIAKLGGGTLFGYVSKMAEPKFPKLEEVGFSASTLGAGMVVGARIAIPSLLVALLGHQMVPYFIRIGWLQPNEEFRKIGFLIALGTILGAALVDLTLIFFKAIQRFKTLQAQAAVQPTEEWKKTSTLKLVLWVMGWGAALVYVASQILQQPLFFVGIAVALVFIFVLINGIANGISDNNPISSAFVIAVVLMATLGLKDPAVGLMCASILLISCTVGVDMQQDRSTGWRLGTNRINQFRYQVIGIVMGAVLAVVLAKVFMATYGVLKVNKFDYPNVEGAKMWQSAMTFKLVGALKGLTDRKDYINHALLLGVGIGLVMEIVRKLIKSNARYRAFSLGTRQGRSFDFVLDAFLIPSPYASSFGGFVSLQATIWFTTGGVLSSLYEEWKKNSHRSETGTVEGEVSGDMSTTSLIGGGLIAGESLAALSLGIYGLIKAVTKR